MSPNKLLRLAIVFVFAAIFTELCAAQTFTVLHSFTRGSDGYIPRGVVLDQQGNLYGTTSYGGSSNQGVVFKLHHASAGWVLYPLYAFQGGVDGRDPTARVVIGPDHVLYGTTQGGLNNVGTVFSLRPQPSFCSAVQCPWVHTILHQFNTTDGATPGAGDLNFDSQGNMYGTTMYGGRGLGVVYELTQSGGAWTESTVFEFRQDGNGDTPYGGITFDAAGNIYGTLSGGGVHGNGAVYELIKSGSGYTYSDLHTFDGTNGKTPDGAVVFDSAGNLYSTTSFGGYDGEDGNGVVFELSPGGSGWTYDVLHRFPQYRYLGGPMVGLTKDASGNFYGSSSSGCQFGYGCIFKLTYSGGAWTYTSLHDFTGGADGSSPMAVTLDADGNLYGVASCYTVGDCNGTVWEITP